jgi:hypothetical protein
MGIATAAVGAGVRVVSPALLLRLTVLTVALWEIGGHIDAWYHTHYGFEIESFFTWPHALLYGAWALLAGLSLLGLAADRRAGYGLVAVGTLLFGLGGPFDFAWHGLFGFEVRIEALLAPSHLWLNVAFTLATVGVLRLARANPYLLALALGAVMRAVLWSTWYSDPLAVDYAAGGALSQHLSGYGSSAWGNSVAVVAGATGLILHSALLSLFLVLGLRHLRLPAGAIAITLLWNGLLTTFATDKFLYLPAVALAALVAELLWARVRAGALGGPDGRVGYWVIGAAVPFVQFAAYFLLMALAGGGIIWTTHLWVGAPFMAAFYGLAAAMLMLPPAWLTAPPSLRTPSP